MNHDGLPGRGLRILYVAVVGLVALGGVVVIVDWGRRGDQLPGGGVAVTGRVVEEQPGFAGALAIVEVAYEAGGKERRARLPVRGSDEHPNEPTYRPGDPVALLVSRTDPDRVQHANWSSDHAATGVPGWVLALAAAGIIAPLILPGPRRRLQEAIAGALKGGGGRGI
jgi:hypothetical protein